MDSSVTWVSLNTNYMPDVMTVDIAVDGDEDADISPSWLSTNSTTPDVNLEFGSWSTLNF